MYTHSYSFNTDICLHVHSAEYTIRLLNQAGRNNYPYNHKYVGNTGNRTRDIWLEKCISNQQLYELNYSTVQIVNMTIFRVFSNRLICQFRGDYPQICTPPPPPPSQLYFVYRLLKIGDCVFASKSYVLIHIKHTSYLKLSKSYSLYQGRIQGGATGAAAPPSGNLTPRKAIKIMIFI